MKKTGFGSNLMFISCQADRQLLLAENILVFYNILQTFQKTEYV